MKTAIEEIRNFNIPHSVHQGPWDSGADVFLPAPFSYTQHDWGTALKGQCHEIFCFWFLSWISFPPPPSPRVFHKDRFDFFRKFAEIFAAQGLPPVSLQMEKIFNQKNFHNFIWSPLGSRGNIYIHFCLQVYFQVSAAWYCSNYLPPVSLIPVASCHRRQICLRYRWHRWQICHRCQQHKGNWWQNLSPVSLIPAANLPPVSLIPAAICHGVIDTGGKFATGVVDTGGAPWLANISANFRKNSKWS